MSNLRQYRPLVEQIRVHQGQYFRSPSVKCFLASCAREWFRVLLSTKKLSRFAKASLQLLIHLIFLCRISTTSLFQHTPWWYRGCSPSKESKYLIMLGCVSFHMIFTILFYVLIYSTSFGLGDHFQHQFYVGFIVYTVIYSRYFLFRKVSII